MSNSILDQLSEKGYKASIVSIDRLQDLKQDIERICQSEQISEKFGGFLQHCFQFNLPDTLPDAQSIFIVAAPSPKGNMVFHHNGAAIPVQIPPSYADMFSGYEGIHETLKQAAGAMGFKVAEARLPEKLLAVRSGLGAYGKNNICYVPGFGSFAKLAAFISDVPCPEDQWREARFMDACADCTACRNSCPTGSILKDRPMIDAERCLCYLNEHPGDFPDWVHPSWHNSIVGCILCQDACPQNQGQSDLIKDFGEFSSTETEMLLNQVPLETLTPGLREKLETISMIVFYPCLSRNLRVLLKQ